MQSAYSRYLVKLLAATLGLALAVALSSVLIDPLGLFGSISLGSLARHRTEKFRTRIGKQELTRHTKCENIVLGSSRVEVAIDPSHPAWAAKVTCNLGLTGGSIWEYVALTKSAVQYGSVKRIFIAPDLVAFNDADRYRQDFAESRLNPEMNETRYLYNGLFGHRIITALYKTVANRITGTETVYDEFGFRKGFLKPFNLDRVFRDVRAKTEQLRAQRKGYSFSESLGHFRELLDLACHRQIETQVVFLPHHALEFEMYRLAGFWDIHNEWKREMLATGQEPRASCSIRFWDFTGYGAPMNEPFPTGEGQASRYYWEQSHLRKELGDRVLDRVYGRTRDPSFGVELEPRTLDALLTRMQIDREAWLGSNARIREYLAREARSERADSRSNAM